MPTARQKGEKGEHKLSRKKKHSFFGHLIYFRVIGKSKPSTRKITIFIKCIILTKYLFYHY